MNEIGFQIIERVEFAIKEQEVDSEIPVELNFLFIKK